MRGSTSRGSQGSANMRQSGKMRPQARAPKGGASPAVQRWMKGQGPNKAAGHKGGISRQGSKG